MSSGPLHLTVLPRGDFCEFVNCWSGALSQKALAQSQGLNSRDHTHIHQVLHGTTSAHIIHRFVEALQNGANILRVHDVAEAAECIKLCGKYQYA